MLQQCMQKGIVELVDGYCYFSYCSHQLYLKARVEEQSKYICTDCEEDLLKCAGRIMHSKVCIHGVCVCIRACVRVCVTVYVSNSM